MRICISQRRIVAWALVLLAISPLLGWILRPVVTNAVTPDPVTAAWARACGGSYHFTSDVTQVTLPLATLTNVGRTSRTEKLYFEGQNDLHASRLEMTLWSEGGSVLQTESGLSIRSEGGKTFARRAGGEWEEIDDVTGAIAPQGDFMTYLAALKDVQPQPAETRGGVTFTRYTFEIDSPRFATYMHQQMEATLRAPRRTARHPRIGGAGLFPRYGRLRRTLGGPGWAALRQILTLQFPPQEEDQVHSQIVVDYSNFGAAAPVSADVASPLRSWLGAAYAPLVKKSLFPIALFLPLLWGCAADLLPPHSLPVHSHHNLSHLLSGRRSPAHDFHQHQICRCPKRQSRRPGSTPERRARRS